MIYVDVMLACVPKARWPYQESCHLFCDVADDLQTLHAFAWRLGLKREWFQRKAGGLPHYDLTRTMREKAVRLGATELDRKATVVQIQAWREKTQPALVQKELI